MIPRHLFVATAILLALAVGMAIYLARVRRNEAFPPAPAREAPHVSPPPAAGPEETVTAWVAHDDSGTLRAQTITIPVASGQQVRAAELLRGLLKIYAAKGSPHQLGAGSEVRAVYLVDRGLAVIDLNAALADGHTSGILPEELTIVSMVQTISTNIPAITRVKFLVEGKDRDTLAGHVDLSGIYDVSRISELARQFSSQ